MEDIADAIVKLIESDDEWLESCVDNYDALGEELSNKLFEILFVELLRKEFSREILQEFFVLWDDRDSFGRLRVWFDLIIVHGNRDAFGWLLTCTLGQDDEKDFNTYNSLFQIGVKRNCLKRILEWLQEEWIDLFEVFDKHLLEIEDYYEVMPEMEEVVARTILQLLDKELPSARSVLFQKWLSQREEEV